jgi:hydrogenase/urease accessory protein HupE
MYRRFLTYFFKKLFILFIYFFAINLAQADVVKPALIEISAHTDGTIKIEIRASIEALLTGINAQYKNTKDAPNAKKYDELRVLEPDKLKAKFLNFKQSMLDSIYLKADGKIIDLELITINIPEAGYTKVPRISTLNLSGNISKNTQKLNWYYPYSFGDNAVRVRQVDKIKEKWHWSQWQWLRKDNPSEAFSLAALFIKPPIYKTIGSYISLGFEHIFPKGTDHILFILGLFFFSSRLKPLLWQVTMFTIAHTITLGLSIYQIVSLPSSIVEPLIALSIAYVGFENVFADKLKTHRLASLFGFGLLHGLGFAGVLAEFGMPDNAFITALISFNIGVELGQLFIILIAFLLFGICCRHKSWYRKIIAVPLSLLIAFIGLYWTFDRLLLI